ncbi:tRNA (adenosine(37)-N6)-threonylcarbamoyltransferase complex ATPase subunit type 1 TsaE [Adhaeribacter terreus]|uniref:tRNA threonylcarbamoyladenosine biosynthesis protein TsaE n=1 Tax=Adhaeribacter terreus TaxID=529703 RepID=A0ABW0E8Z9_9BACT
MAAIAETGKTLHVASLENLPQAAAAFHTFLTENPTVSVVLFEGEMGAGKTTFIKAICRELGVTEAVSSPTFSLVNEYEGRDGKRIYHFDFYRLNEEREALDIGIYEYLDSGNLCLIEWPSKVENLLPEHVLLVNIEADANGQRTITLKLT